MLVLPHLELEVHVIELVVLLVVLDECGVLALAIEEPVLSLR
jgi:hypothetical protein